MSNFLALLIVQSDTLMGRITTYWEKSPLHYALTANPGRMYHRYLLEFWYTAEVGKDEKNITFTLKDGGKPRVITLDSFRETLHLNYLRPPAAYFMKLKGINWREALYQMGHDRVA